MKLLCMTEVDFIPKEYQNHLEQGKVSWQSPSNIALVKYWGKYGEQLPKNASISFTLSNCHTNTTLGFEPKSSEGFEFAVFLDGKLAPNFAPKIQTFFERIERYMPFLKEYSFTIETSNSFPHSSGIASSASGMSALALCLMSVERMLCSSRSQEGGMSEAYFLQKATFLARLGSGSACRSIEGPVVVWGVHNEIDGSDDLFGTKFPFDLHNNFKNYQDTVLLVDQGEKQISSTVGHDLMYDHPYSESRFLQAEKNLSNLIPVLKEGNLAKFIEIVENEALSLHAMMLTSNPYFILMKPNTLEIINRIWKYRRETGSSVCFTLDAGANVHVLYPENEKETVLAYIKNELFAFCQDGQYICDQIGLGAKML